ncbi:MAG: TetR/AcrR family transcriptional regulator [Balneolaceae bacterium]|nr:TetR/AcrR family transcriptional regulator [Balneolaceae bacterium]
MDKNTDRKQEIRDAALSELKAKGRSGARLQSIADNIGVTKAMIHYYFNTKEELCDEVFREAYRQLMSSLMDVLESDAPVFPKIEQFIDAAVDRFANHADLLLFVIQELDTGPQSVNEIMVELTDYDSTVLERQLEEAASNYEIAPIESSQLVANMISLCMFPYLGKAFFEGLLAMDDEAYRSFLEKRKDIAADTIINWLAS